VEGRFLGLPAIAVSLVGDNPKHFDTAAQAVRDLVMHLMEHPLPANTVLNVNVPDVPYSQLQGFESTRLGNRHRAEPVIPMRDPKGREVYWVGPAGAGQEAGPGTDFYAIEHNRVSVTPLQVDLTRYDHIARIAEWLPKGLSK
jgi:5'-nucleotidase